METTAPDWSCTLRIPMHQVGRLVTLADVLGLFDEGTWDWNVMEFESVAVAGSSLDVLALEEAVLATERGCAFTDSELRELAGEIQQVIQAEIVGSCNADVRADASGTRVVVRAFDSTDWCIDGIAWPPDTASDCWFDVEFVQPLIVSVEVHLGPTVRRIADPRRVGVVVAAG